MNEQKEEKGRFAPSPTGRMHMGNVYAALMSWLDARRAGGKWVLRIEDLDPQRSRMEYARLLEDDLHWLGLDWDEGGIDGAGPNGPYCQSLRSDIYEHYYQRLAEMGLLYKCRCTRADIMASQAPHESDGRVVYSGRCRPGAEPPFTLTDGPGSTRLYVPDRQIEFVDETYGPQSVNLSEHCGDFVVRRADGAWAYQLAVVVDDALMDITRVVRGADLLLSTAQQLYIYELLGFPSPTFAHLPLVCNAAGQRLSKRDHSMSMEALRQRYTPAEVIGLAAHQAGLLPTPAPITPQQLVRINA
ncbi:MAG: tRNA glutamyl-Q(34) synthetase GluQRS [Muribaculaceae bacterium]|nr:tRNA glutamyl-Q(34) synthetase GluQRS [Muribaculaceae bacterium]